MIAYSDTHNKIGGEVQEYQVLNELIDYSNRSDLNCLKHTRFLFEFDGMPLEEQLKLYNEKLSKLVVRAVYSGSKSIHLIVQFSDKCEDMCREWYKRIWTYLASEYFKGADTQCKNPARLTRTPNVVRSDTGRVQTLLSSSPDNYIDEAIPELLDRLQIQMRGWKADDYLRKLIEDDKNGKFRDKNNDGVCKKYSTVKRYLDNPFLKVRGNGVSSTWLFAAVCTCLKFKDQVTLDEVLWKARREHWKESEINHVLSSARTRLK